MPRDRLYTSLADLYMQLRRLEFPSIGRLVQARDGVQVANSVLTLDTNMQELENLAPSNIIDFCYGDSGALLRSADRYIEMLLDLADNAFRKGSAAVSSEQETEDRMYHLHLFRQHAELCVDHGLDRGPFILAQGDLQIFNLILDNDMNMVSVLDWEWSASLCYNYRYREHLERLDCFLPILRSQDGERFGNGLSTGEWDKQKQHSGFALANALEHWTGMDWFAN
ncbi:hypothetical protein VTI74DRAFT_8368 [Chaetomium olivicolor]